MNNNFMRKNSINNNMGYNNMNNNNNNFGIGLGVHQMVRSQTMNNNTMTMNNNILGGQNNPMEQSAMKMGCNFGELGELEKILVEIIGSRTSTELKKIKEIYYTRYNKNLDTDVAFKTSGDFQRILLALLQCKRTYSLNADNEICKKDANDLLKIGVGNWTSYIEVVYNIFATRSPANLRLIYQYFKKQSGKGLLSTVYSEFNGNTKILLETILKANLDPYGFYAKRIHDSILASNYCDLIRNICTRNTKDLFNIRQIYKKNYGSDLLTDIRKLNNTNYNEILCSIVSKSK
jgi:annexin A7/11